MKVKIEIKNRFTGKILFEFETENNTILKTLKEAIMRGADLRGADLRGADLSGAYLRGADLSGLKIQKTAVFTGLYKYIAMPIITQDNKHYVRLGCYTRLVSDWQNDFWNNSNEFPNNGDLDSKYRLMAFEFCKKWIELNK